MKFGNTIEAAMGVGYDIFVFADGEFKLVRDRGYLLFATELLSEDSVRLFPKPLYVKAGYFDEIGFIRAFLLNTAVRRHTHEHERVALVAPIYPNVIDESQLPVQSFREMPLKASRYGIGIFGKKLDGTEELFTAAVHGAQAQKFRVFLAESNDKVEFKVQPPSDIMKNIFEAAFLRFGLKTEVKA